jgi:hypothetical protein
MTLSYLKNKQHIYNWREKNREEWNDYMRDINRKQYLEHKDKINQKRNELNKLREMICILHNVNYLGKSKYSIY